MEKRIVVGLVKYIAVVIVWIVVGTTAILSHSLVIIATALMTALLVSIMVLD